MAAAALPTRFGLLLYPQWEVLDVFGPAEALNVLSRPEFGAGYKHFSLSIISTTLEPVPAMAAGNPFQQALTPTHTVDNAPPLDVLLVPGGLGSGSKDTDPLVKFIRDRYPSLMYLITVCTGADLAARAGVLDGRKATTNKAAWVAPTPFP
ncbi:hypothetical protein GP486_005512 [Trichoglossum hirsutum]|uniref:DJ-1/PfpI domain-containing protein n=1 Tax=Trichoglossum hirsutum TaxID=265104 RepID=A0A9P8L900_9PEZI|nr:hypothetical protein GP486_005512 [Trichoglossum hirsutum]